MRTLRWMLAASVVAMAAMPATADCIDFFEAATGIIPGSPLRSGTALVSGDFDADGIPDLAVAQSAWNRIAVHRGRGDGSFDPVVAHATGARPIFVATGNIDGATPTDLVSVDHFSGQVAALLGRGDGTFAPWSNPAVGRSPMAAVVADLDGDGDADVAVANGGWIDLATSSNDPSDVTVLLGNGDGTFVEGAAYATGIRATAIVAAELSGDGVIDLAVAHRNDDNVVLLLGNGDGTFTLGNAYSTGAGSAPRALATGDFDGDGATDLTVALSGNNTVAVLLGNGNGTFGDATGFPTGTTPFTVATADFDGDGAIDLAVANAASQDVSVLRGLANGSFEPALTFATGPSPRGIVVADFDRDGRQDLAVADESDDSFSVLLNRGDCASLDAIDPASGPAAGGQTVVLTGTHLAGTIAVRFDEIAAAAFTVDSPNQITAITPSHAPGAVSVTVISGGGTAIAAAGYTFVAAPALTAISPDAGPVTGGQVVTLTGIALTGATSVTFGGTAATSFTVDTDTQITAVTPAHDAGTVDVVVTTIGGTGNATYTYVAPPAIGLVLPNIGPLSGGETVTITGTNFTGATSVTFGGATASFIVDSATQLTVTPPAHSAGMVDIVVITPGGTATLANGYTYFAAATIVSVTPDAGPTSGGQIVTITGTDFTDATSVAFGGIAAASFAVDSATQITAVTPAHAPGVVDVTVVTPGGTTTAPGAYSFAAEAAVPLLSPWLLVLLAMVLAGLAALRLN